MAITDSTAPEEAEEARPRSQHTGSLLPTCCGESPRAFGQRVSLGDQRPASAACSEALCQADSSGAGHLQQHSHAVSTRWRVPTERGSFSPCLLPLGALVFLDFSLYSFYSRRRSCPSSDISRPRGKGPSLIQPHQRRQRKHGHAANIQGACSRHAAGKVPVPLGRECHWETKGQHLQLAVKLCAKLIAQELATCSSTVMP